MKDILNNLFEHRSLDKQTAKEILKNLTQGKYNSSQVAAFLTVYLMRSITVEELAGFREAMLELCIPVNLKDYDVIDLCGTGGDGKDTFNISTLASFIVAGAGQRVAKHGNNSVSSVCGSSNVLAYFGYEFTNDETRIRQSVEEAGICFLHAPLFHPAMKNVAPIRKELAVKTFFNILGPMVNPAFPNKQLVGVFSLDLARLYSYLYQRLDKQFVILHALDGYDEISLTGGFKIIDNQGERIIYPEELGMSTVSPEELYGGSTVEEAAKIFINILEGNGTEAQNQAVIANAAMALHCGKDKSSLSDSIEIARDALKSGKALNTFKQLIKLNQN